MEKLLLINCSPRKNGYCNMLLDATREYYSIKHKDVFDEIDTLDLSKIKLEGCIDCQYCLKHDTCFKQDKVVDILNTMYDYDRVIMFLPSFYCAVDANTKCLIDRSYFMYNNPREIKGSIAMCVCCGIENPENYLGIATSFKYFAMSLCKKNLGYRAFTNTDHINENSLKEYNNILIEFLDSMDNE